MNFKKLSINALSIIFMLSCSNLFYSCESKEIEKTEDPLEETQIPDTAPADTVKTMLAAPIQIQLTANELGMTKDHTDFAMKFFAMVNNSDTKVENVIVSPFSMGMALAVLRNGAAGETKQAIQQTMGMKDFPDSEINAYFRKLKDSLMATDTTVSLGIANSVWYKENAYVIKKDFEHLSNTYYDAPVTGLDYSQMPNAVATVNKWCSDNTNGLIDKFFPENSKLCDVEILNALYFKGDWTREYKFDASMTVKQGFTVSEGKKVQANMMHNNTMELKYYEDDVLSLTSLPYGNKAYSIYFALPRSGKTFAEMTERLTVSGYWSQCVARTRERQVDLYIPKFTLRYRNEELTKILSQLGMAVAFSSNAQFPNIAENSNFGIGSVIQETYIQVDEKGTEAAAVTEIGLIGSDGTPPTPAVFRADRPFLFVIQENSTGTILFMGKVGDPTKE